MNRITHQDLDGMLKRLDRDMRSTNLLAEDEHMLVNHGSKTYGNSFQVWAWCMQAPEAGAALQHLSRMPFGTFHFGFTARDCYDRMHAMCVALELVTP